MKLENWVLLGIAVYLLTTENEVVVGIKERMKLRKKAMEGFEPVKPPREGDFGYMQQSEAGSY